MELPSLDPTTRQAVLSHAARVELGAGSVLFHPGDVCSQFFIMLSGQVRVHRLARSGREMVLYHVRAGESCILTTLCLLAAEVYSAGAVVESDARALALPAAQFDALLETTPGFRRLVFTSYAQRIADLMARIEELSDVPVDVRLAACLLARGGSEGVILATHQDLATDIGTAREVVSRTMMRLVRQSVLSGTRGRVVILNRAKLSAIATQG